MMVDSTPTVQGPPSSTASILPSMSSSIRSAEVGLGRPEVFPEGAAMGVSAAAMISRQTGWAGQRIPTVSSPPVVRLGTLLRRSSTMVSGPGQNAPARAWALGGMFLQNRSSHPASGMWRIRGLSWGRPLA